MMISEKSDFADVSINGVLNVSIICSKSKTFNSRAREIMFCMMSSLAVAPAGVRLYALYVP